MALDSSLSNAPVKVIAPGRGGVAGELAECWRSRELLYFLAWRDISVRYKQTVLGAAWAVLQPLANMLIITLIFHYVAGMQSPHGIPYPVFTFAALLPWQLFHNSLLRSSESVVAESRLIAKVYFPRMLIPFSSVASGMLDFAVSFVVLLALMLYYGIYPGWAIVCLPLIVLLAVLAALSMGLWLSALNVKYRDFHHIVPFMLNAWLFISPVAYPAAAVLKKLPPSLAWLYSLNPAAGVVEGFRWALLGEFGLAPEMLLFSILLVLVVFISGLFYFRKTERVFADLM
jgi:lipopolysaccharide transport system permease protein